MKRFVLGIAVVLIVACATRRVRSPFYASDDGCTTLVVRNHNFADVTIYWSDTHERVGMATGLTTSEFKVCERPMRPAVFTLNAVGGAFDFDVEAAGGTLSYDPTVIVITPNPRGRGSYVIGG